MQDFALAREAGLVAFRMKNGRIGVYNAASDSASPVPGGKDFPFGRLQIDGSLELAL